MVDAGKPLHVKIEIEDFEKTFQEFESQHKSYVGIFKGSLDPETKVNWCPDCVAVEEPLKNVFFPLAQEKKIAILEVSVGKKEDWKTQTHPLRIHKKIALKKIPSLLYITPSGVIKRLEEEEILDLELLREFLD